MRKGIYAKRHTSIQICIYNFEYWGKNCVLPLRQVAKNKTKFFLESFIRANQVIFNLVSNFYVDSLAHLTWNKAYSFEGVMP